MRMTNQDGNELVWAIVHARSGKLLLFDGRCPIYWSRTVATQQAIERGLVVRGPTATATIVRVAVAVQPSEARR